MLTEDEENLVFILLTYNNDTKGKLLKATSGDLVQVEQTFSG